MWIYEPGGPATGATSGGRCDDDARPAVFIAHGFSQSDPVAYIDLIEHLVSVGNIVVYPSYDFTGGDRATLEESYRVVDAGIAAAVADDERIDTTRVGWWGHSHGGGMVPFLVQQGAARGWGSEGLWMAVVAQAFTQLVGDGPIPVPPGTRAIVVALQQDAMADARLGIDVFESLVLPAEQKHHVTIQSGTHDGAPFVADHTAPSGIQGQSDAVDVLLWRDADLLQTCAFHHVGCDADLGSLPDAAGNPIQHAIVSDHPVDGGPFPAILAECDALFAADLNPRIARCGPTRL